MHLHHHLHHVTVSLMRRPKYDLGYIVRKLFKYEMFSGDIAIIYPKFPTFYEGGGFLGTHIPKPHTPPLLACYTTRVPLDHHAILHKPTKNSFHIKVSSISINLELLMSSVRDPHLYDFMKIGSFSNFLNVQCNLLSELNFIC